MTTEILLMAAPWHLRYASVGGADFRMLNERWMVAGIAAGIGIGFVRLAARPGMGRRNCPPVELARGLALLETEW